MVGTIISSAIGFGCGILFFAIGVHAARREKPMAFWSGTEVKASELTDVEGYNQANGRMWKGYSLWYFASGAAMYWSEYLGAALMVLSCTLGIGLLVMRYRRIYETYRVR